MERAITASEANQHFSELLRDVSEGKSFTVTSRGRPVARLLPIDCHEESRSVRQLLKFLTKLPMRYSGNWSRNDLHE
jgi:prevent-host-death family protein